MAITIDWATKIINIPKTDMTLIQASPEIRELDVDWFRLQLKDIEDKITWAKETFDFEEIYYATHDLVAGMIIIMMEDEVATGGTANDTGLLLRKYLVKDLYFLATHPVLTLGWRNKLLKHNPFTKIVFTNTIPRTYEKQTGGEVLDLSIAPQFGSVLFKILNAM